tara:strand:+ start:71 stop:682 length:612 start_codon:yes stop_codon:yes gene_type:complete
MTLPASGNAISINSLVGEYGGSAPHSMSEYYRGGGLVANHSNNANVPTSGTISLSNFYGQSNTSPAPTSYSYSMTNGNGGLGSIVGFASATSIGSLSNNPQSTAFSNGFNPTWVVMGSSTSIGKAGQSITDLRLIASGTYSNSGFTSWFIPSSCLNLGNLVGNKTLLRANASHSTGGGNTTWEWASQSFQFSTSGSGTNIINQ